jgi:hypothetical protein
VGRLHLLHYYEDLGSMSVQNVYTDRISELGDLLWRMTGKFIGNIAGTPNVNNFGTAFTSK